MLNRRDKQLIEKHFPKEVSENLTDRELKYFLSAMPRHYTKNRSIEKLHSLWLLATKRSMKRVKQRYDFIKNIIIKNIPCVNGVYTLYHDSGIDGLYQYTIEWDSFIKSYSSSYNIVNSADRQGKLESMLSDDKAYEYGLKFRYIDHDLSTDFHHKLFFKMWEQIKVKLVDHYAKDKRPCIAEVVTIVIGGIQYHISAANHYAGYMKFSWEGKVNNIVINLDDEK